jgi:hypothetical protein
VVLKAGCRKTWDNVPWRESIGRIWTSEGSTDPRSRTQTWWSLRRTYDEMIRLEREGEVEDVPGRFIGSLEEELRRDVLDFGEEVEGELVKERRRRCLPFSALLDPTWRSALSLPLLPSSSHLQQVVNTRAALLSNYEVLQLLTELEADHIARTRIAQRLKKEEEDAAAATGHPVSENLRTIEVEVRLVSRYHSQGLFFSNIPYIQAIQYLNADYQPTRVQTAQGIQRLTKDLAPYGLTKAEKLQIVNLTPVEPVELYVVRASSWSHQLARSFFLSRSLRSWKTDWGTAWTKCWASCVPRLPHHRPPQ